MVSSGPTDPERRQERPPFDGLRLLAVEDHAIARILLGAMLEPLGVVTTLVADGEAAREATDDAVFDVVFVDLGLPDVPGDVLADELSTLPGCRRAVFVAVTGRARPRDLPPVFDDWLTKPYSVRDLYDTLCTATGRVPRPNAVTSRAGDRR